MSSGVSSLNSKPDTTTPSNSSSTDSIKKKEESSENLTQSEKEDDSDNNCNQNNKNKNTEDRSATLLKQKLIAEENLFKKLISELQSSQDDDNLKFACLLIFNRLENLQKHRRLRKKDLVEFYQLISIKFVIKLLKYGDTDSSNPSSESTSPVSENPPTNENMNENDNELSDFVMLAIQILRNIFNLQMTREAFMEHFNIKLLTREDKNLLVRKYPEIFMDRLDYLSKNDRPFDVVYYLHSNYVLEDMISIESSNRLPKIKSATKNILKSVFKTKNLTHGFLKILLSVVVKFTDQLLCPIPYSRTSSFRINDKNTDFEFQSLMATRANAEIRYWVELGDLEDISNNGLSEFDRLHFHNCLMILDNFTNLLEYIEEGDEDDEYLEDEDSNPLANNINPNTFISDNNLEFIKKADEFALKTMLSLLQHLIECNLRGDTDKYVHKNKTIDEVMTDQGKEKLKDVKVVSVFDQLPEIQMFEVYKALACFYSLQVHIGNSINLTSEFPNWLIACISKIQNKYEKTQSRDIIKQFAPVMFKLLCFNSERLSTEFYDFAKNCFVPEIKEIDSSIYNEFLELF